MLGAMNFWIGIVLYAINKPSNLNENIRTNEFNKQNTSTSNKSDSNKDPKKRSARKFSDTILHARFPGGKQEVAKTFILSGEKPTSAIINQLLGTNITDKDLSSLLNGPKHLFKDLTEHKKVLATL